MDIVWNENEQFTFAVADHAFNLIANCNNIEL